MAPDLIDGEPPADLLVVGAGAKATAVAAKVHAINTLGLGSIAMTIVEGNEPAASWTGLNGMTSGEEPLAITPIKDVGFPYESDATFGAIGVELNRALLGCSWQHYLVAQGGFARWLNADLPAVRHRDYGAYLKWVLSRATAGVRIVRGRVQEIAFGADGEGWTAEVAASGPASDRGSDPGEGASEGTTRRYAGRALMLTGPGVHRHLPHDPAADPLLFHCDSRRGELACIPLDGRPEIGIVGGGESALSCLAFLRGFRPHARLTVYTPTLPLSRGESFLENRVFSNPDSVSWSALDLQTRRTFVNQCDRGVFGPDGLAAIAYDDHCRFVTGRVAHIGVGPGGRGVSVDYASAEGPRTGRHDFLVNCTGFDLLEQLRGLFPDDVRATIEDTVGPLWDRPPGTEIPFGRSLELAGLRPRLHIPGLAGVSQGPGFANLGCLGLLADRVLQPILQGDPWAATPARERAGDTASATESR